EEYSRNPTEKLLKDIQEAKKHIPLLHGQLSKATGTPQDGSLSPWDSEVEEGGVGAADGEQTPSSLVESGSDGTWTNNTVSPSPLPESPCQRETPCHSPKTTPRDSLNSCPSHDAEDTPDLNCNFQCSVGSPSSRLNPQIIGAEDDYFDTEHKENLKVAVPESIASELERVRDRVALERERSCAEHIISKIEDVLLTSQPTEEEKCLEPKRVRINFLPKIKKSIKTEKEGEEKVKKPRFPNILGPPRRPSRVDSTSISKAIEMNKQRGPQKQLSQLALSVPDHPESSAGSTCGSQSSEPGLDVATHPSAFIASPPHSAPASQGSDPTGRDFDSALTGSTRATPRTGWPTPPAHALTSAPAPWTNCRRRSARVTGFKMEAPPNQPGDVPSEDDLGNEIECEQDPPNWQTLVSREILAGLTPQEIKRQEVINELFYTERAHLRMLKVLDNVFYQKLTRDGILPPGDIKHIFTNLEEIVQLHVSITEQVTVIRKKNETSVIDLIGDDLLAWEAESNRLCRRLQLKDIIPVEMQRLTKYPLLLESIAKYTEDAEERDKVKRAGECCRTILNYVNQTVKEAENKQRLEDYQRRLDLSSLKQSENPMISEFKKQDERLVLKCHSKNLAGSADTKHIFSPIIKLNTVLVRSVATDNKSFFVLSMSDNGAQIYELMAQTVSEQRTWQCLITQRADTMKTKPHNIIPLPQTDAERDTVEVISTGMPKLSKDPDRLSTESIQFAEKCVTSSPGLQPTPTLINPFDSVKSDDKEEVSPPLLDRREEEEEEEEVEELDEEEVEVFMDGELADRLPFQGIAIDDQEPHDAFGMPPSRAEEALRTLAALRQVLLNHMTSREEGSDKDKENRKEKEQRKCRARGARLLRTTSLRDPEDNNTSTSGPRSAAASSPGSSENSTSERTEAGREEGAPGSSEIPSGDTGFFETSEDYDDDGQASGEGGGGAQWGSDSGIDLKKLLSSSSQTGDAGPNLRRQEVETKYNELRQRLSETATDTEENKGTVNY
ncbi:unnamed protein product, partial [Coregonus sp. 'balchen']